MLENQKNNIVITFIQEKDGNISYKEIIPVKKGDEYPYSLQLNKDNEIEWIKEDSENLKKIIQDLFLVVSEQQKRIDELTDKLNKIINHLK